MLRLTSAFFSTINALLLARLFNCLCDFSMVFASSSCLLNVTALLFSRSVISLFAFSIDCSASCSLRSTAPRALVIRSNSARRSCRREPLPAAAFSKVWLLSWSSLGRRFSRSSTSAMLFWASSSARVLLRVSISFLSAGIEVVNSSSCCSSSAERLFLKAEANSLS